MNIAFLTRSISREAGGIFEVEVALAKELTKLGCTVSAYGDADEHSEVDLARWDPIVPKCFRHFGNDSFRYAPTMKREFLAETFDLCHLHSLWSYTSLIASKWTVQKGKPLLVSPNGMLDTWALKNSKWKKWLISLIIEKRMLTRAACIQANTEKDIADYHGFGLRNPIAVIPNGVYAPDISHLENSKGRFSSGLKKQAVYLGRIHPKKGLANLVHAWGLNKQKLRLEGWQFVIAGKDEAGHLSELKKLSGDYGLILGTKEQGASADIIIMGPTYGAEKLALLTSSHVFVLPSFSEGLPMAVLEAWAHGVPAMISPQCNLDIGFNSGAAISVDPTIESISNGLMTLLDHTSEDLASMGQRARAVVEEHFVWTSIAKQMHALYQWLVAGGCRPDFVT